MKNRIIGGLSLRPVYRVGGAFYGYNVYPKGLRDHWSCKGRIRIASDGKSCVIMGDNREIDARPSLEEAVALIASY